MQRYGDECWQHNKGEKELRRPPGGKGVPPKRRCAHNTLEVGDGKTQNSLTSVSTDTMVIKLLKYKEMQDNETTLDGYSFDIRKLTVKEVFRLMDVDDRHIDTLIGARETMKNGKERQAISNSALYRLAGNSIVVNCMTLMFENLLFPDTEPTTGDQLKLF